MSAKTTVAFYRSFVYFELLISLAWVGGDAVFTCYPPTLKKNERYLKLQAAIGDGANWVEVAETLKRAGFISINRIDDDPKTTLDRRRYELKLLGQTGWLITFAVRALVNRLKTSFKELTDDDLEGVFD